MNHFRAKRFYKKLAEGIIIEQKGKRTILVEVPDTLQLIGKGRSAFVFKIKGEERALKWFYPPFEHIALQEAENYRKVEGIDFFPTVYESGLNYLVMDYIRGKTFFQCLSEGIPLTDQYVHQVDQALDAARDAGLNPSDIHLHNLLLTADNRVCLIDIARFSQTKTCSQWTDLKNGYETHYHRVYFPKKVPPWLMHTVAKLYQFNHKS